jgi:Tol biopolymer transport system component
MASKSLLLDLLKKKNQIFILSMEGGEPIQLTKDKYGASNLNGPQ